MPRGRENARCRTGPHAPGPLIPRCMHGPANPAAYPLPVRLSALWISCGLQATGRTCNAHGAGINGLGRCFVKPLAIGLIIMARVWRKSGKLHGDAPHSAPGPKVHHGLGSPSPQPTGLRPGSFAGFQGATGDIPVSRPASETVGRWRSNACMSAGRMMLKSSVKPIAICR